MGDFLNDKLKSKNTECPLKKKFIIVFKVLYLKTPKDSKGLHLGFNHV